MTFVDEVKIRVVAGSGGDGAVGFHREPFKPKGGPDGGDGGDGGDVIVRAHGSLATLLDLRDHPHVKAASGRSGAGSRKHGARGADRIVLVPPGTIVYDENGTLIADLAAPGHELVVAKGGRGGRGNARFATSVRRAPAFSEKGEPGEERWLRLELRLLADIGLVGFPNAGKSTLIARISAARPKIADYPFTTLTPNLGVVRVGEESFVVADIPGLVPGAHEGKGLGDRFLRHVRRAAVLVFLVDLAAIDRDPGSDVQVLRGELAAFDPDLAVRPSIVALNKVDAARDRLEDVLNEVPEALPISAVTGEGVDRLLERMVAEVREARLRAPQRVGYVRHVVRDEPLRVEKEGQGWRVRGTRVERAVVVTDMDNEEAVGRLQRKLIAMGVERMLLQAGAAPGDEVHIGDVAFDFQPEGAEGAAP